MPTVKEMHLPKPKNWQDFETIVSDAYSQKWKSSNLQKHGRAGQRQNGVDIYGPDDIGRQVGIQCKRFLSALTMDTIEKEVAAAEKFPNKLSTLYIATTGDYDAPLQQKVRILADKRVAQDKFAVALIFWDDIVGGLALNPAVFKAHYPQIELSHSQQADRERLVAALEAGYFGADLWNYVLLVYGEAGVLAQSDPDELFATLAVIERRVQQLLAPTDAEPIIDSLRAIRVGCEQPKTSESDWDPVEDHGKRVQTRLRRASSLLSLAEGNVLDLGLQLGHLYHNMDDTPSRDSQEQLKKKALTVVPPESAEDVIKGFKAAAKVTSGHRWVMKIYNLLLRELRFSR